MPDPRRRRCHDVTRPRVTTVAVLVVSLVLGATAVAWAHRGSVHDLVIDRVPDGIEASGDVAAVPRIVVTVPGAATTTVLDDAGRPWLRLGPTGVEADLASPAWYASLDPRGEGVEVPADAPSGWSRVAVEPGWSWYDIDLAPRNDPDLQHRWSIPVLVDGRPDAIGGTLEESSYEGLWTTTLDDPGAVEGADVTVAQGQVPVFAVQLRGASEVVVLGRSLEPMVRVTERGAEDNLASPTWGEQARLRLSTSTTRLGQEVLDATAEPVWVARDDGSVLATWGEVRASLPRAVPDSRRATSLRFEVPLLVDGERVDLTGTTSWQGEQPPLVPVARTPWLLGLASLGAALLAAGVLRLVERRRAAQAAGGTPRGRATASTTAAPDGGGAPGR